jgi:hypothetical protein
VGRLDCAQLSGTTGRAVTVTAPPQFQQLGSGPGSRPSTSQAPQNQWTTIWAPTISSSPSLCRRGTRDSSCACSRWPGLWRSASRSSPAYRHLPLSLSGRPMPPVRSPGYLPGTPGSIPGTPVAARRKRTLGGPLSSAAGSLCRQRQRPPLKTVNRHRDVALAERSGAGQALWGNGLSVRPGHFVSGWNT